MGIRSAWRDAKTVVIESGPPGPDLVPVLDTTRKGRRIRAAEERRAKKRAQRKEGGHVRDC